MKVCFDLLSHSLSEEEEIAVFQVLICTIFKIIVLQSGIMAESQRVKGFFPTLTLLTLLIGFT